MAAAHKALRYMNQFGCLADKCPDTCCSGWTVFLNEKHYYLYAQILRDQGKEPEQYLARLGGTNAQGFGSIKFDSTGYCTFLEGGLCSLHAKHGDKVLSPVCSTYPRKYLVVANRVEASAALSCPEVARLALFDEESVLPVDHRPSLTHQQLGRQLLKGKPKTPEAQHYDAIRAFGLELLLSPRMIAPKLFILGYFAQKLSELAAGRSQISAAELQPLLDRFRDPNHLDAIEEQFEFVSVEETNPIGLSVLQRILVNVIGIAPSRRIADFLGLVWGSYGVARLTNEDGSAFLEQTLKIDVVSMWAEYQARRKAIDDKLVAEFDLYLRNLAIHSWLTQPFSDYESLLGYLERSLLIELGMIKFFVTGYLVMDKLSVETLQRAVIDSTVAFHRLFAHLEKRDELVVSALPQLDATGVVKLSPLLAL